MNPRKIGVTQSRLMELLSYDESTGVFTWRIKPARRYQAGSVAGGVHKSTGYVRICIEGCTHLAHRLVWVYMTGEPPPAYIDHRDGNRMNNAWDNLRETTPSHNLQNQRKATSRSKSGVMGVQQRTPGSFRASINIDGKDTTIGHFPTAEEAAAAYIATKRRVHAGCTL